MIQVILQSTNRDRMLGYNIQCCVEIWPSLTWDWPGLLSITAKFAALVAVDRYNLKFQERSTPDPRIKGLCGVCSCGASLKST